MLMLALSEWFSHENIYRASLGLELCCYNTFFFSPASSVILQHGFCVLLVCCHSLPFMGFLPPTSLFPPWWVGGMCSAFIYIVFLKPQSTPLVGSLIQCCLGCAFRLSVIFQESNLMFSVEVSSVVWGSFSCTQ